MPYQILFQFWNQVLFLKFYLIPAAHAFQFQLPYLSAAVPAAAVLAVPLKISVSAGDSYIVGFCRWSNNKPNQAFSRCRVNIQFLLVIT